MDRRVLIGVLLTGLIGVIGEPAVAQVKLRPLVAIYVDGKGTPILEPEGVGCGGNGEILVADTGGGRLVRFSLDDDAIRPAGEYTIAELARPSHAEIAASGKIYALDAKTQRILRIDPSKGFEGYVEPQGESEQFSPRSFTLDGDDNLWVLDVLSERVLVLDPTGRVRRRIAFPEEYGVLSDLTVDSRGTVFVIDTVDKQILSAAKGASALSPLAENLQGKASFPTSIAADSRGNLYVGDQNAGNILVLGLDGSFRARRSGKGWKKGQLRYPTKLCVDDKDLMFVADRANNRIQVFTIVH